MVVLAARPPGCLSAQAPAPIIDTVVIINRNIFDPGDPTIGPLTPFANAANTLHVRTHASVIRRMLFLNQGEPYDSARAVESERALRGLNVFRQVSIDTSHVASRLALRVVTADGWSTKPQLNFSSAAGDVTWSGGLQEENLLGTATSLTALHVKTPDRSWNSFAYLNPHFVGRRPRLFAIYQALSDGERGAWSLGVPFYESATPRSFQISGEAGTQRQLMFRDTLQVNSLTTERHALRFTVGGGVALRASSRGYLRMWMSGSWRREDLVPESATVVPRSVFGTVGAGIELAQSRFRVVREVNTYARREDLTLSQVLRLGLWAAPRAWGYPAGRAGVGAEAFAQVTSMWPGAWVVLRGAANGVYNFNPWVDQTGPRLFDAHAFTGNRTVWLVVEDRILVADDVAGLVGVGLAPFVEWGGAWDDDESPRIGGDVGLALRLGPTRAVRGDVQEIAFGWRFGASVPTGARWELSFRRGMSF